MVTLDFCLIAIGVIASIRLVVASLAAKERLVRGVMKTLSYVISYGRTQFVFSALLRVFSNKRSIGLSAPRSINHATQCRLTRTWHSDLHFVLCKYFGGSMLIRCHSRTITDCVSHFCSCPRARSKLYSSQESIWFCLSFCCV